jgi:hypothetical protein
MEVPEAAELPLAAETLEMAEELVVAGEMKEGVEAAVVEKEESVPLVVAPLAAVEPEAVAEVRVPEVVPGVEETHEVVVALEPEVKSVPEEVPVEEKTPEVVVPLVVSEPEVKVAVLEEPVVAALSEVVAPPEVVETEAKEPEGAGRDAVGWRMPEPVAVAPPSRGPRVVMRLMLLVLLVLVGWLAYKAVVLKGH